MKKFIFIFIFIPNILIASSMNNIGEKGNPLEIDKIIEVKMFDNYYEPNQFEIKKNQTIKFIVYNYGSQVHEFNIATKDMHFKHQPEMLRLVQNEILLVDRIDRKKMKKMSKKDHSMGHKHDNSVLLEPNENAEIVWKFNTDLNLEIACNVPGHYESGMVSKIIKDK